MVKNFFIKFFGWVLSIAIFLGCCALFVWADANITNSFLVGVIIGVGMILMTVFITAILFITDYFVNEKYCSIKSQHGKLRRETY